MCPSCLGTEADDESPLLKKKSAKTAKSLSRAHDASAVCASLMLTGGTFLGFWSATYVVFEDPCAAMAMWTSCVRFFCC